MNSLILISGHLVLPENLLQSLMGAGEGVPFAGNNPTCYAGYSVCCLKLVMSKLGPK